VIILDYPGVPATVVRADHMQTALHDKAPDASILGRYQGGTPENGEKSMTDALRQHPDLNVIMSINDAGAYGAVKALEASGKKPGDVIISSVDAQDQAKDFIRRGYFFRASLDTDPVSIGRYAVIAGVKMLAGSVVPRQILLKGLMVTAQTLGAATATTVPATAVATP
ncbi:MAG TPA: substrate-binding domain-containing protein, partial [Aggregatilineales bacterium]|nr:substrate-binding domain-containing protein [Aggregatilineales bacterium]